MPASTPVRRGGCADFWLCQCPTYRPRRRLFQGQIKIEEYSQLLVDLHTVYESLEGALRHHATDRHIAAIYFPVELNRVPSLQQDLQFLGATGMQPTRAAVKYAEHLKGLSPLRLVAHAYVRYLGDLSGGQQLSQRVRKSLNLPGCSGTLFYEFPAIADLKAFKDLFRQRLDSLDLPDQDIFVVTSEAVTAFRLNTAIFEAIDRIA